MGGMIEGRVGKGIQPETLSEVKGRREVPFFIGLRVRRVHFSLPPRYAFCAHVGRIEAVGHVYEVERRRL